MDRKNKKWDPATKYTLAQRLAWKEKKINEAVENYINNFSEFCRQKELKEAKRMKKASIYYRENCDKPIKNYTVHDIP